MIDEAISMRTSIASPLFNLNSQGYFTSVAGYTNARYVPFTDSAKHIYSQILAVLDYYEIEYCVFAGTLVGYVRNGRMPPWMDDIDIMIFEKDIPSFEEIAAPQLRACGFNCKIVGKQYAGGGYHILGLQQGGTRNETIPFSATQDISVPWAQCDVFFSEVDNTNIIRNKKGWGLYHRKEIPIEWVMPSKTVKMDDMEFKTFADIESDVLQEYGDVRSELVVKTHSTTFLSAASLDWAVIYEEFNRIVKNTVSPLPPSLSHETYNAYSPVNGIVCTPDKETSFDIIMKQIVDNNASEVKLVDDDQIFWVMDIKRLIPNILVSVQVNTLIAVKRAVHLRQFIDVVKAKNSNLLEIYDEMASSMISIVGDRQFPGNRKVDNVL